MAEILSGGLNWGSTQQAIVTMDKEGHPLTCCNPVTGECLGGGGSSDFSTAEVTVNNITMPSTPTYIEVLQLCAAAEADEYGYPACASAIAINQEIAGQTIPVILYKGCQVIPNSYIESKIKNITGSASLTENGLEITGNCSFDVDYTV